MHLTITWGLGSKSHCVQVGMDLLVEDEQVFGCHADFHDTIYFSELGASAVILEAGRPCTQRLM